MGCYFMWNHIVGSPGSLWSMVIGVEAGDSIYSISKGLRIKSGSCSLEADALLLCYCLQLLENNCDYVCNVVTDCIRGYGVFFVPSH